MYLEKLNDKTAVKKLVCKYLAKRYGKPVEFFYQNLEESRVGDKFYYRRTDEEGLSQGIMYLANDFYFACNKEEYEMFDGNWIKYIYSILVRMDYDYARTYFDYIEMAMTRDVNDRLRKRLRVINQEYDNAVKTAQLVRNRKAEGIAADMESIRRHNTEILDALAPHRNLHGDI